MGITDQQLIEASAVRFQVEFSQGIEEENDWGDLVRNVEAVQSYTDPVSGEVVLIWFEGDPGMYLDTGQVNFETLTPRKIGVKAEDYVKGFMETLPKLRLSVVREATAEHVRRMGNAAGVSQRNGFWQRILRGDSAEFGTSYDGQFMFDTDHPGKNSAGQVIFQSNLFDLELSEQNLGIVLKAMTSYRDEYGVPFGNRWSSKLDDNKADSFRLYHGPELTGTVLEMTQHSDSNPRRYAGRFTPVLNDMFEGPYANYWAVGFPHGDPAKKPLAFVDAGGALIETNGTHTEPGRKHNRAEFIARAAWGFSYYKWQSMALCRGANN